MSLIILSDDNSNSNELPEISFPSSQHSRNSLDSDAIFDQLSKHTLLAGREHTLTKRVDSGISSGGSIVDLERSQSRASTKKKFHKGSSSSSLSQGKRKSTVSEDAIDKSAKLLEQSKKKRRLAVDKPLRCKAVEKTKKITPAACMNYVKVEIHPSLGAMWYMINVLEELDTTGVEVSLNEDQDPDLVLWSTKTTHGDTGQSARGPHCVYVCEASRAAGLVSARGLARHVRDKQPPRTRLTVALFGVKDYFKSCNRKNHNGEKITEIELELAITDMMVWADCDATSVNSPGELGLLIKQFTKAIAETPHKVASREHDEQANFYTKGCNKKCVAVDKDGIGLRRLWQQMIAILPKSSLGHARAFCNKYNSPLALYQALKLPDTVNKIADVSLTAIAVPASKSRRLGPEFARKLNILFTAEDGSTLLD